MSKATIAINGYTFVVPHIQCWFMNTVENLDFTETGTVEVIMKDQKDPIVMYCGKTSWATAHDKEKNDIQKKDILRKQMEISSLIEKAVESYYRPNVSAPRITHVETA